MDVFDMNEIEAYIEPRKFNQIKSANILQYASIKQIAFFSPLLLNYVLWPSMSSRCLKELINVCWRYEHHKRSLNGRDLF